MKRDGGAFKEDACGRERYSVGMSTRPATPRFTRILVPYDGSEQSEAALGYGIALAQAGAALDVLHVVDDVPVMSESSIVSPVVFDPQPLVDALDAEARAVLETALARCRAAGIEAQTQLLHELHVDGILKAARENGDDLIVFGTHGRTGLARTFLGSTTESVIRAAHIPVLVVHAGMTPT
jgi:nucleotide-binding universal stress UspA family protein